MTIQKADKSTGIIKGVSVITGGVTAKGHNLDVDDTTLKQIHQCATKMGKVPVKENHKGGAGDVTGYLENFRISGHKLLADWHLLDNYPRRNQILETAERMPSGVGLSVAFISPETPEVGKDGRAKARCKELVSVDYVAMPAANPDGLFASINGKQIEFAYGGGRIASGLYGAANTLKGLPSGLLRGMRKHPRAITAGAGLAGALAARRLIKKREEEEPTARRGIRTAAGVAGLVAGGYGASRLLRGGFLRPKGLPGLQGFSARQNEQRPSAARRIAIAGAGLGGAVLGSRIGLKLAQSAAYRKTKTGESLAGRIIARPKSGHSGILHTGAVTGQGVVHNQPKKGITVEPVGSFAKGKPLYVQHGKSGSIASEKTAALLEKLRAYRYNCIGNNCEHTARVLTGQPRRSPQLRGALAGAAIGGVAGAGITARVTRKKEDRRHFEHNGKLTELGASIESNAGSTEDTRIEAHNLRSLCHRIMLMPDEVTRLIESGELKPMERFNKSGMTVFKASDLNRLRKQSLETKVAKSLKETNAFDFPEGHPSRKGMAKLLVDKVMRETRESLKSI